MVEHLIIQLVAYIKIIETNNIKNKSHASEIYFFMIKVKFLDKKIYNYENQKIE